MQQIDELLAGSLTQEDEDAVLEELQAITQARAGQGVAWSSRWNRAQRLPGRDKDTGSPPTYRVRHHSPLLDTNT